MADPEVPFMSQVVLDCPRPRELAEFYRVLLGYAYRPGDEQPPSGAPDPRGEDWLVLRPSRDDRSSGRGIAFQRSDDHRPAFWSATEPVPADAQRQMVHLDLSVPDAAALVRQRERALDLGATELWDRFDDEEEPLYVFSDPAGHPFCIFVGGPASD